MPFSVKSILLKWINVAICLVFIFIINILEGVNTKLSFFGFKYKRVSSKFSLTTPHNLSVMFNFIRTIALLYYKL